MHPWLTDASARLADAGGTDRDLLALDEATITALLDLARVAAHDSGDRTNAPLLCYLAGLEHGRTGVALDTLLAAARGDAGTNAG